VHLLGRLVLALTPKHLREVVHGTRENVGLVLLGPSVAETVVEKPIRSIVTWSIVLEIRQSAFYTRTHKQLLEV
jgi:hypothetical protein